MVSSFHNINIIMDRTGAILIATNGLVMVKVAMNQIGSCTYPTQQPP